MDDGTITQDMTGVSIRQFVAEHAQTPPGKESELRIRKFHYKYGGTLDQQIDEAVQRKLDKLLSDFFSNRLNASKKLSDQMNGAK